MNNKTYSPKIKHIKRRWHLIDLKGKILGRISTQIATLLQGKTKTYYAPHLDCGDYVVAINADEVKVTGRKQKQKIYFRHSGFPGGVTETPLEKMIQKDSRKVIEFAISGMLPKNKLRTPRLRRLKVFTGNAHDYKDKFKSQNKEK